MEINFLEGLNSTTNFHYAEFFAGIGLVRKGLENAGWQCTFANDIDRVKGEIYAKNFGNECLRVDDVANLHSTDIPDITLVTASFPCQDLSLAGNRKGLKGERSSTFFEFSRILHELATERRLPQGVLIENVTGLLNSANGKDIREILVLMNQLGYSCDLLIINAFHFLPQSRPRVFILGVNNCIPETDLSQCDSYFRHPCRPKAIQKVILANSDLSWNLLDLPLLPKLQITLPELIQASNHNKWFSNSDIKREVSYIRDNSKTRLERARHLAASTGKTIYLTGYRRMRKGKVCLETRDDGIAGCLRTGSGGSSQQLLIAVSSDRIQMRYMSAREYGRLQGVEDSFWIPDNQGVGRHAFGDAVAVPVVTWIGRELKRHLVVHSERRILLNQVTEIPVVNLQNATN